jgi:hypothetical protein
MTVVIRSQADHATLAAAPIVSKTAFAGRLPATDDRLQRSIDLVKKALKLDATLTPTDIYVHLPN